MTSLKAFILGYTGETGKALVNVLAHDTYFSRVVLIGRRNVELGLSENSDKFVGIPKYIYSAPLLNDFRS